MSTTGSEVSAKIARLMEPTRSPSKLVRYCAYISRQFSSNIPEL